MAKIVGAFFWRESVEDLADAVPEVVDGSFGGLSQQGLEFGEGQLDRIEIGRIRRQEHQRRAALFDEVSNGFALVGRQVVHDHDVALRQGRPQDLIDVSDEGVPVHRPVENIRRRDGVPSQTRGEGRREPMPEGLFADQPLSSFAATGSANHFGVGPGLVDEHQLLGIKSGLARLPRRPRFGDVRSGLLGGVESFF